MNVLVINPPLYFLNGYPTDLDVTVPPLGILYLTSYISQYSTNIDITPMDVGSQFLSLHEIIQYIDERAFDVIGISAMTPQLQGAVELATEIKAFDSNLHVILGGAHVTADPMFIKRHNEIFDYGVVGEGESAFLELLEALQRGENVQSLIQGEFINELDNIPFPDKSLLGDQSDDSPSSMMFSRGCPYKCYYCSRPAISKKVRYRSVQSMLSEIKHEYIKNSGKIDFQDDTFTINKKKVVELCNAIIEEKLKLKWSCNTRADLVNYELLSLMKQAGCELIHFGIESGDDTLRKDVILKGKISNSLIKNTFQICQDLGIRVGAYFMIGHKFESKKQIEQTKNFILESKINLLGISIPTPFPGSLLYEMARNDGIINNAIIDKFATKKLGEGYAGNYPIYIDQNLDKKYVFDKRKEIIRSFYLRPRIIVQFLRDNITSLKGLKKLVVDGLSVVLRGTSSRQPYRYKPERAYNELK